MLDVRLFGHLEMTLDGEPFRLATPRKTLQLLAYLLLHRGAVVQREYLAYLLYPDDEEGSARAKLRATLSDLPKILPQPAERYLTIDADKVAWKPEAALWLDVDAFEKAAGDRERLTEAIELYRGDLLPDLYDEWLDTIRERHRNTYLRCLTERVSEARRKADLASAIETARKVLAIDPWREDVVRRIIAMRYESGDRAGALREYAAFAKRLKDEMGAQPMAETAAVAERIARDEAPADETREEEHALGTRGAAVLPFVGRRDEMERLLEMWSRSARGRGACAFVCGEAGIGKSRLVLEFARSVEDRGGRVLAGTTSAPEAFPYESVVDALRSALPLVAALRPNVALACVAALLPELHARAALPSAPRLDAESERVRLFESLFQTLASLAKARPLLLVLEDLQLAQSASIELLQFLLRRIAGLQAMIVVTYRDEESPQLQTLHRLRREARAAMGAQSFWLSRLSLADVEDLRTALPETNARSAEALVSASQGNPLFLTQIVSDAREGAAVTQPASLQEIVKRRIERLSEGARAAAQIAACIGDRFSRDTIRAVSAWQEGQLTDALDELLDRRIIGEAAGRSFLEYAFAHDLVHDAVAATIAPKDAATRRRRVARVLEELYPERFSELSAALAGHYECAGDVANAARCYLEAVRRSIAIGALEEAHALCLRALGLELDARARAELLLEGVSVESRRGDTVARGAALAALKTADRELGDPQIHRNTLLAEIEVTAATGDLAAQESAVGSLRASLPAGDDVWSATAFLAEAELAVTHGQLAEAHGAAASALACSENAGDEPGMGRALSSLARIEGFQGNLTAAAATLDRAARIAAQAGDPVLELMALGSGWVIAYQRRDLVRGRELARRCAELAVKLGDRAAEAQALSRLGISLLASDADAAEIRRNFAAALRTYEESGDKTKTAALLMNQSVLEARLGFFQRAISATEKAIELFVQAGDERGRIGALINTVYLHACIRDAATAREAFARALDDTRRHGFSLLEASALENMAFAEGAVGNFPRAIELAEASFEVRSRSESSVWSSQTLAGIAVWYANAGNLQAAIEAATRLLSDEDAIMRGADWPSFCFWSAAQVMRLGGKTAEAKRAFERARTLMDASAKALEPEDRASFLALPFHRDIVQAVATGGWPEPPR